MNKMAKSRRWTIGAWTCGTLLLLLALAALYANSRAMPASRVLAEARRELVRGNPVRAESLARRVLATTPRESWALLVAAEAAIGQNRPNAALEYYLQIPDDGSEAAVSGLFGAGEVLAH